MQKSLVLVVLLSACSPDAAGLQPGQYLMNYQSFAGACSNGDRWGMQEPYTVEQWNLSKNRDIWTLDLTGNGTLGGVFNFEQLSFAIQDKVDDGTGCMYPYSMIFTVIYDKPGFINGILTTTYLPCNSDNICASHADMIGTVIE
jgi:hypothetical protein